MARTNNNLEHPSPNGDYPGDDYDLWSVQGRGGSERHQGYFHRNNPWVDDMRQGSNNKDIDAAYERAVEWEADWYNLQEQRAYNEAMRDEQRAYDSPLADLMRKRAAGYNPDIADGGAGGAGAGSTSAGVPPMQIADQQAQSKFKNAYDDTAQVFQGIQTAGNFISSVASSFSSIVGGISALRKLPAELKLIDAQATNMEASANLSNVQAGEITALLSGKKEYQSLLNDAQSIANSNSILESLMNMSDRLNPDSDIAPILSAMGIGEDQHSAYKSAFGELMKNPHAVARYHAGKVAANRTKGQSAIFTQEYFTQLYDTTSRLDKMSADTALIRERINKSIAQLLQDSDYAENTAESQIVGSEMQLKSLEHSYEMLKKDIEAYAGYLVKHAGAVQTAQSRIDTLTKKGLGNLSTREQVEYQFLTEVGLPSLNACGANDTQLINSILAEVQRNRYLSDTPERPNLNGQSSVLQDLSIYWGTLVNGAKNVNDIAHEWTTAFLQALGVGATAYAGFKIGSRPGMSSQTITNSAPGYDGEMRETSRQVIDYRY